MNYINSCIKTIQLYYKVDFVINAALNSDWVRISLCVSLGSHRYGTLEGNLAYVPVMDPEFGSWHFSLHLLSHFSTSLDHEYSCTISMCHRAISVLQISPYSLLMFDSSSSCHNICPSQNRVSIFIPLYFSSIIRVFINSTLEKSQSPNLTFLEKSSLHQILEHTKPNCSLVPSSC